MAIVAAIARAVAIFAAIVSAMAVCAAIASTMAIVAASAGTLAIVAASAGATMLAVFAVMGARRARSGARPGGAVKVDANGQVDGFFREV
jgi:hypothetical protein